MYCILKEVTVTIDAENFIEWERSLLNFEKTSFEERVIIKCQWREVGGGFWLRGIAKCKGSEKNVEGYLQITNYSLRLDFSVF